MHILIVLLNEPLVMPLAKFTVLVLVLLLTHLLLRNLDKLIAHLQLRLLILSPS